ncbi:energy transducer TonB [Motiliproteus sediminis]|uniref:energy transducer TonB n=1 Tax=Motiliproteus sediminis TaxID=1468178 RepID=UPI001AEF6BA2|nr:energy transducer TonB [Motiliproteus sediminis]
MSVAAAPHVSPSDRLGFTLFLAVVIHAILILGVVFKVDEPPRVEQTLEVTLASFRSDKAPDQADFIAQHNQQGSGDLEERQAPSTREVAVFQDNESKPLAAQQQPVIAERMAINPRPAPPAETLADPEQRRQARVEQPQELISSVNQRARAELQDLQPTPEAAAPPATGVATSLLARSLEIAALEAKMDLYSQTRARQPKIRRLYSASTRESFDAIYLDAWRRKVERVGNLNYPEEAHRRRLYGNLRLLVVIRPDGELDRVEVLKSSGHKVLDDAARRIVKLSAPFAPFPPELRRQADLVEIIRTWKFEKARFGVNG